jgi:hypothetical protein
MSRVSSNFLRISCADHRKRQADRFISLNSLSLIAQLSVNDF